MSPAARFAAFVLFAVLAFTKGFGAQPAEPPNVVIIFVDDMGYGDPGCFGSKIKTPNLDRMAKEGIRLTSFCVPQAVCSASRAALLTGCYPNRVGILGALMPNSKTALNTNEITLATLLKRQGYATGMFGKWHLGDSSKFLPPRHGFDEYFGLPYSNDMWPAHPTARSYPPLPLIEGTHVIQLMPDQTQLTTWYTERATNFIHSHKANPFFLYVAHNMPHVPLHVSSKFAGKSGIGLYADVIMEIDWSVGQILQSIKSAGIENKTLVIFTSDNGPWLPYGDHAGSAGPLREGKATEFEGGIREPFIARWPGHLPKGRVINDLVASMDLYPTIAALAHAPLPKDRIIDGHDVWPILSGKPGAVNPREFLYCYWGGELHAIRSGPWKLHFTHTYPHVLIPGTGGRPGKGEIRTITAPALFNLEDDPAEATDMASRHPEIVERLSKAAQQAREDLGDTLSKTVGRNIRPVGKQD